MYEYDETEHRMENIVIRPDLNEMLRWYFVIKGLEDAYKGGFYMGQIDFPKDYPFKPPVLRFLTPNGRFKVGVTLCTSFSHFHSESWSPNWTAEKMILGLISMMFESAEHGANDAGVGGIVSTDGYKKEVALESMAYNVKNKLFCELFGDLMQ